MRWTRPGGHPIRYLSFFCRVIVISASRYGKANWRMDTQNIENTPHGNWKRFVKRCCLSNGTLESKSRFEYLNYYEYTDHKKGREGGDLNLSAACMHVLSLPLPPMCRKCSNWSKNVPGVCMGAGQIPPTFIYFMALSTLGSACKQEGRQAHTWNRTMFSTLSLSCFSLSFYSVSLSLSSVGRKGYILSQWCNFTSGRGERKKERKNGRIFCCFQSDSVQFCRPFSRCWRENNLLQIYAKIGRREKSFQGSVQQLSPRALLPLSLLSLSLSLSVFLLVFVVCFFPSVFGVIAWESLHALTMHIQNCGTRETKEGEREWILHERRWENKEKERYRWCPWAVERICSFSPSRDEISQDNGP